MQVIKIDTRTFLVDWKYKDFLRLGYEFQGATIVRLERTEQLGGEYVQVTVEEGGYKI